MPPAKGTIAILLALWIGAAAFFSFVAAPAAFRTLARSDAGRFVGSVFPAYHAFGLTIATACLVLAWADRRTGSALGLRGWLLGFTLSQAAGVAALLWVRAVKTAQASDPALDLSARFSAAHGISMALNLLSLLLAAAALFVSIR